MDSGINDAYHSYYCCYGIPCVTYRQISCSYEIFILPIDRQKIVQLKLPQIVCIISGCNQVQEVITDNKSIKQRPGKRFPGFLFAAINVNIVNSKVLGRLICYTILLSGVLLELQ